MNEEITDTLIRKAKEKAKALGVNICIAVVDDGAFLTGFLRMDGSFKGAVDVAIGKARTAVLFPFPTEQFGEAVQANRLTGIELSNNGLMCFGGGHPISQGGAPIGAIGISGGTSEQDTEIAKYAIKSLC